jgi:hypothetical protein
MDTGKMMRAAFVGLFCFALLATACSSTEAPGPSGTGMGGNATGSVASTTGLTDPLVGIWESAPYTLADVDTVLRAQFKDSVIDTIEPIGGCIPKEGDIHVLSLHFGAGQLVISDSINGGESKEGWTGSYAVQDADTFGAGGDSGLYITVDYTIEGDRLFTDLIADRFPDHTPWSDAQDGPGASKLNGVVGKPLADRICQVGIYEITPFTKTG